MFHLFIFLPLLILQCGQRHSGAGAYPSDLERRRGYTLASTHTHTHTHTNDQSHSHLWSVANQPNLHVLRTLGGSQVRMEPATSSLCRMCRYELFVNFVVVGEKDLLKS